jgi:hypothetical protein
MAFIIRWSARRALHNPNGMAVYHSVVCVKRCLVEVLLTGSNLPKVRRQVEMGVKDCVLHLAKCVIHTRKWVSFLARNGIKATVANA